jgi:hypothetical protein
MINEKNFQSILECVWLCASACLRLCVQPKSSESTDLKRQRKNVFESMHVMSCFTNIHTLTLHSTTTDINAFYKFLCSFQKTISRNISFYKPCTTPFRVDKPSHKHTNKKKQTVQTSQSVSFDLIFSEISHIEETLNKFCTSSPVSLAFSLKSTPRIIVIITHTLILMHLVGKHKLKYMYMYVYH